MQNSKYFDHWRIQELYKEKSIGMRKIFVNKKRMTVYAKPYFIKLFKNSNMITSKSIMLEISK